MEPPIASANVQCLLPQPARTAVLAGPPLTPAIFDPRYSGVRSARLESAVGRCLPTLFGGQPGESGRPLTIHCGAEAARYPALGDEESYRLELSAAGVSISAPLEWGVLRALATLTQLCAEPTPVAAQRIDDQPRFPWRGLMLDVARHFIPLPDLLRTLDAMALFKLNVLHLHLSDDQGFRFPSSRFPRLPGREHYHREELRRLVNHAAERGIRVVPELDVPGHATSWLDAYPEWGSSGVAPSRRFGVHEACLDPTRPAVMEAVTVVFDELCEAFPDDFVHLGGDEVHPAWWTADPGVQAFMAEHGFGHVADLQAWFTDRLADHLRARGKRVLGWDEVLHPRLPEAVAVQSWRGATARDRALQSGHDCVVSAHYYLDLLYPADVHYGFDPEAPEATLLEVEDALQRDPRLAHVAAGMEWTRQWRATAPAQPSTSRGQVLGAEACLWSELVDRAVLDVRLWSRLPALAERFWSPADCRDTRDMYRRLERVLQQLPRWAGVDVAGDVQRLVSRAGVDVAWWPLVEMLEPVKWYARLLGEDALAARLSGREMPLARPYDADTPLDRVADALPPESPAVRALEDLTRAEAAGDAAARARLETLAQCWAALPPGHGPAELELPASHLARLGRTVLGVLEGSLGGVSARQELALAAAPMGEYLLAPVPVLTDWLDRRQARGGDAGAVS